MYIKKIIGNYGENIAKDYLIKENYEIIERNYNTTFGEIDIIAKKEDEIIFIEVKTRTNLKYGEPASSITKEKIDHLIKSAWYYLTRTNQEHKNIRFDALEIYLGREKYIINHIKQII